MWLFENLRARILKSIITWSEMGQQTTQAKEVYFNTKTICVGLSSAVFKICEQRSSANVLLNLPP